MHAPPIIIAKPTEPISAAGANAGAKAGANAGADGEDFAAMIPTAPDDRQGADTTDDSRAESQEGEAASSTTADAVRHDESPRNVIQSLIADPKVTPGGSSPARSEIEFVGNIVAAPGAATFDQPPSNEGAARPAIAGQRQASAQQALAVFPPIETPPTGATAGQAGAADLADIVGSTTGRTPTGSRDGPMSLAGMLTDFTTPAFTTPAQARPTVVSPMQNAGGEPTTVDPAAVEPAGASSTIGSPAIISNGIPGDALPGPLPVPPLAARAAAPIDPDLGELDLDVRIAEPGRSRAGNPNASTATGPAAGAGNGPASSAGATANGSGIASGIVGGTIVDRDGVVAAARLDVGSPSIETPSDAAAKASPMASGSNANSALAQGGTTNDTAVAFGADVRLGADAVRPAAIDQAFRGQPLQPAAEQVAVQISRAVQQGADRITLQLKPGSLGHISVELEIGPDNRLIAVIAADRPETLDLLQRDARALERALNEAGLKTDSGSLSFNLRGDGGGGANGESADDAGGWSSYAAPPNTDVATPMPVYARTPGVGGGIDIRV